MLDIKNQVKALLQLDDGWSYGKGLTFNPIVVDETLNILNECDQFKFNRIEVKPRVTGDITLFLYRNMSYCEIDITTALNFNIRLYDADELLFTSTKVDKNKLLEIIKEFNK